MYMSAYIHMYTGVKGMGSRVRVDLILDEKGCGLRNLWLRVWGFVLRVRVLHDEGAKP